jgi:hypothetical protein
MRSLKPLIGDNGPKRKSCDRFAATYRTLARHYQVGIGRLGGIVGLLVVGVLLTYRSTMTSRFYAATVPKLLAGILIVLHGRQIPYPVSAELQRWGYRRENLS